MTHNNTLSVEKNNKKVRTKNKHESIKMLRVPLPTATLCDTSLNDASLDHGQLLHRPEPSAGSPFPIGQFSMKASFVTGISP